MQEDGHLIDSVIRLSQGELPDGVSEETLKQFEAKLGSPLPELLRQLLRRANGGETILARSDRPFIPNSLETMGTTELWKYMLQVVEESTAGDFEPDAFIGRYLPLGDDYGGEVIVVDLRSKPRFRVLWSCGDYGDPEMYEVIADSFEQFVADTVDESLREDPVPSEPKKPEAKPIPTDENTSRVTEMFQRRSLTCTPHHMELSSSRATLWYAVKGESIAPFFFSFAAKHAPMDKFGYMLFETKQEPTLVTAQDGSLLAKTYRTIHRAYDAINDIQGHLWGEKPFDFDKCRHSKDSASLHIFETSLQHYVEPDIGKGCNLAVLLKKDTEIWRLRFELIYLQDADHANAAINLLLSFGYDWL